MTNRKLTLRSKCNAVADLQYGLPSDCHRGSWDVFMQDADIDRTWTQLALCGGFNVDRGDLRRLCSLASLRELDLNFFDARFAKFARVLRPQQSHS